MCACESMTRYMRHLLPALTRGGPLCLHRANDISMENSKALPEASVLLNKAAPVEEGFCACTAQRAPCAELGLTGTKLGCGEGGCGACTVMVSSSEDGQLWHRSVNACLAPLYSVEGMHVVTVEGACLASF